jgi:hypothetical protein
MITHNNTYTQHTAHLLVKRDDGVRCCEHARIASLRHTDEQRQRVRQYDIAYVPTSTPTNTHTHTSPASVYTTYSATLSAAQ